MTGNPQIRVLVADDQELVRRGFCALVAAEDDLEIVAEASTGSEAIDRAFAARPDVTSEATVLADLTRRERDVLAEVGRGRNNAEFGERLFSPLAAKIHVSRIMTKLAARDRAQLVVISYETGLAVPGDRQPE